MHISGIFRKKDKINLDHLERRDWELLTMAVLMILVLTLYIMVSHLWEMGDAPREWFRDLISVKTYLAGSTFLILLFCIYVVVKNMELRKLRRQLFDQKAELAKMASTLEEITAFYEISSDILSKQNLENILSKIIKGSLHTLQGDRATIYLLDKETKILKPQVSYASNPLYEKVNLLEEREVAKKTILKDSPAILRQPEDFQGFFNYHQREDKITSLICYPICLEGRPA